MRRFEMPLKFNFEKEIELGNYREVLIDYDDVHHTDARLLARTICMIDDMTGLLLDLEDFLKYNTDADRFVDRIREIKAFIETDIGDGGNNWKDEEEDEDDDY